MRLDRRTLLRGLGGAAIALPFLEAMSPKKANAAPQPKRLIVLVNQNGAVMDRWRPSAGALNLATSDLLSPLAGYESDIVLVDGVDCKAAQQQNHGVSGVAMLSGARSGMPGAVEINGPSIDQRVAQVIGTATKKASLELGLLCEEAYFAAGPGQRLPTRNDPFAAFTELFSDAQTNTEELERVRKRRESVLDGAASDIEKLKPRISSADQAKLDAHLTAVREVEKRLVAGLTCTPPTGIGNPVDVWGNENYIAVTDVHLELITLSLACDVTRVASLQWDGPGGTWDHFGSSWPEVVALGSQYANMWVHDIGHESADAHAVIGRWYSQKVAELIDRLKARVETDGSTLFDNTVILWANEMGEAGTHDPGNCPFVLAGGVNSGLATGKHVSLPHPGWWGGGEDARSNNDLLLSVLRLFDIQDVTFGDADFCTGPVTQVLA